MKAGREKQLRKTHVSVFSTASDYGTPPRLNSPDRTTLGPIHGSMLLRFRVERWVSDMLS